MHAVELCDWLMMEELVGGGQLSAKAEGVDLQSLVPPSMQAMVQATVDQLPLVPGLVLRCASVLASSGGGKFSLPCLLHTLPQGLVHNMADLEEQLEVVQAANLIQKQVEIPSGSSVLRDGFAWKVTLSPSMIHNIFIYTDETLKISFLWLRVCSSCLAKSGNKHRMLLWVLWLRVWGGGFFTFFHILILACIR
jgi:hypothetical protein